MWLAVGIRSIVLDAHGVLDILRVRFDHDPVWFGAVARTDAAVVQCEPTQVQIASAAVVRTLTRMTVAEGTVGDQEGSRTSGTSSSTTRPRFLRMCLRIPCSQRRRCASSQRPQTTDEERLWMAPLDRTALVCCGCALLAPAFILLAVCRDSQRGFSLHPRLDEQYLLASGQDCENRSYIPLKPGKFIVDIWKDASGADAGFSVNAPCDAPGVQCRGACP